MAAMAASDGSSISCGSRDDKTSHMSPKICSQSTKKLWSQRNRFLFVWCRQGMTRVMYREPPHHPAPENTLPAPQYPADLYLRQNELGSSWKMGKAQFKAPEKPWVWTKHSPSIFLVTPNRPEWELCTDLATWEDVVQCGERMWILVPSNTLANRQLVACIRVAVAWHLCDTCLATRRNPKLSRTLRVAGEKKSWWTQGRISLQFSDRIKETEKHRLQPKTSVSLNKWKSDFGCCFGVPVADPRCCSCCKFWFFPNKPGASSGSAHFLDAKCPISSHKLYWKTP